MALIQFAITLFVSAFILFLVQPIIGKLILPKLGGTPQVWNTCMVFFQTMLLLGYFYTHFVTNVLKPRMQLIVHSLLLGLPILILAPGIINTSAPFDYIRGTWTPPLGSNPIIPTLTLLTLVVGLPFLVVATTAPLLQKWFSLTGHPAARDPYFLYGASNLGSMLSLIAYPWAIEPYLRLAPQGWLYFIGYLVLAALVLFCVFSVFAKTANLPSPAAATASSAAPRGEANLATAIQSEPARLTRDNPATRSIAPDDKVDGARRLRWILLAAVPSSLMLGVTSHITTDLSPMPLFWLIPLAIYLATFIFVFARWPIDWIEVAHPAVLYIQPVAIVLMIVGLTAHFPYWQIPAFFHVLGFTLTTFACHGELAKDRPSPKHLTDFYLMMSVGGMLGGMLNGLVAPLVPYFFEFNTAIVGACMLRPKMPWGDWLERMIAPASPGAASSIAKPDAESSLPLILDGVVGIVITIVSLVIGMMIPGNPAGFILPAFAALAFIGRPLRFGLPIAGILLAHTYVMSNIDRTVFQDRSYFGILKVKFENRPGATDYPYTQLVHGHILHGQNYKLNDEKDRGNPAKDFTRYPTTYYHKHGPIGRMMDTFNWFRDPVEGNTYHSDARMPAAILGQLAGNGFGPLPFGALVETWSEPPCATIGLGTGTMASYGRPFQHVHIYEIDNHVRRLSFPNKKLGYFNRLEIPSIEAERTRAYFTYLIDAVDRGSAVQVLMGDARLRMALPYANYYTNTDRGGGPELFYKMMVVDAFSSDAIPAHLITKEAIQMYFEHLAEDGVLCLHTSNRYVRLPKVIADVAEELKLSALRGHDAPADAVQQKLRGFSTSEWVMVARKREYLRKLTPPPGGQNMGGAYWSVPPASGTGRYLWTDDYYSLLSIMGGRDDD